MQAGRIGTAHHRAQHLDHQGAGLVAVGLVDGGDVRAHQRIFDAAPDDDGYFLADGNAGVKQRAHRAHAGQMVVDDHGTGTGRAGQQLLHGLVAGAAVERVVGQVDRIDRQAGGAHAVQKTVTPLAREIEGQRRADHGDALVAQRQQVAASQCDARLVVEVEPGVGLVDLGAAVGDKGKVLLEQVSNALIVDECAAHHQAVHAAPAHHLFVRRQLILLGDGRNDQVHLALFKRGRHAADHVQEHRIAQVAGQQRIDDAEHIGAAHGQAARHGIGFVTGLFGGGHDALAREHIHFRIAIQSAADGGL